MNIILDTHIFLWTLSGPRQLSKARRATIESRANTIYVSAISIAEITIKASLGKLDIPFDPVIEAEKCGFELLDFRATDALQLQKMPFHHRNPFDRMLIAQGIANDFTIMTDDPQFKHYDSALIR